MPEVASHPRWINGEKGYVTPQPGLQMGNLVPRAHVPFGQHQDTELWNNQFPVTKILGLPVPRRMRGLVYMASRDKVEVDTFHKVIQYALEKLGKSKFGFERTAVSNFKSKRHEGSGIPELRVLVLTKRHVGSGNKIAKWAKIAFRGQAGWKLEINLTRELARSN